MRDFRSEKYGALNIGTRKRLLFFDDPELGAGAVVVNLHDDERTQNVAMALVEWAEKVIDVEVARRVSNHRNGSEK